MENKREKRNRNISSSSNQNRNNIIIILSMNLDLQNCLHNTWLKKEGKIIFWCNFLMVAGLSWPQFCTKKSQHQNHIYWNTDQWRVSICSPLDHKLQHLSEWKGVHTLHLLSFHQIHTTAQCLLLQKALLWVSPWKLPQSTGLFANQTSLHWIMFHLVHLSLLH